MQRINVLRYDGMNTAVADPNKALSPTEKNIMIILLATQQTKAFYNAAKLFYQAGTLTVAILTEASEITDDCMEFFTLVEPDNLYETTRALINPIFMQYHNYSHYDFSNLKQTLCDTKHFMVVQTIGKGVNCMEKAINNLRLHLKPERLKAVERISMIIYFNVESKNPIFIGKKAQAVKDYISAQPESVKIIWTAYQDPAMKFDEIRISLIAAGKELH